MNLRETLVMPADRPLDVLIHTRYSTDEQSQSSIDGQINSCQRFLTANLPRDCTLEQVNVEIIREPEISGEIADRPGINQVWAGIKTHRWDVILAEESSRLYRHMTFASQFFDTAVDAGIRVICPTDFIDTADEDWPERLHAALGHHGRANHFTRRRIKRAQENRWLSGAAMGPLAIGYRRRPSIPATATDPARGPFFDSIDEERKPVIVEIFERTANDEPPWAIADWLTSITFPKAKNSQKPEWSAGNVTSLLRRPIYRGEEVFRTKFSKRELRTGRSKLVWNTADGVLTRKSEHLRMVSDWLWYRANAVIDRRCTRLHPPRGPEHPLAGKPRDSRKLLSTLFVCGICGGLMHAEGRNEGGYRCANAKVYACWNRATCLRAQAHPAILRQVIDALMSVAGVRDRLVARVQELHATGGDIAAERRSLESEARKLTTSIENIGLAIERGAGSIDSLAERLGGRERELKLVRSRLEELASREGQRAALPSPEELLGHLESLRADLIAGDRRAPVILRSLLDGPIRAVPYQQFGTDKVVLRAEFEVTLTSGLPAVIGESIRQDGIETVGGITLVRRPLVVDLFEMSTVPLHAVEAHELRETGMSLSKIGAALGISKRLADFAARLGGSMAAHGLTDPFVRLTERPERVSRWNRSRGDRDAGGEHRQAS
jgi:DNA invertase Pin-like site-specific DNA recombinase